MTALPPDELANLTIPAPGGKEAQLRAFLYEILSRMKYQCDLQTGNYVYRMGEPLVMTKEGHDMLMTLLKPDPFPSDQ